MFLWYTKFAFETPKNPIAERLVYSLDMREIARMRYGPYGARISPVVEEL